MIRFIHDNVSTPLDGLDTPSNITMLFSWQEKHLIGTRKKWFGFSPQFVLFIKDIIPKSEKNIHLTMHEERPSH